MAQSVARLRTIYSHLSNLLTKSISLLFILLLPTLIQFTNPASCTAAQCPQPAANGRQPFPSELQNIFDKAGTNRLGNDGPTLPQIFKGYPGLSKVDPYVPCILLRSVAYVESSGWKQFVANYGDTGPTLIAPDCGYGIMQITSSMSGGGGFDAARVAREPAYNIGTGALFLINKWNETSQVIGNNDPAIVENWYYAVWAYNSFSNTNNPNNPNFDPQRGIWKCNDTQDGTKWPYQEKVWGCAANPPQYPIGTFLWEPTALTLPERSLITNPPSAHIATPLPFHLSCSVRFVPVSDRDYAPCAPNPVQNGGFESGVYKWSTSGNTKFFSSNGYSGKYSAWMGGNSGSIDKLYQTVTIPRSNPHGKPVISAYLNFYWFVRAEDTISNDDYLYIRLRTLSGQNLRTLKILTDEDNSRTWNVSSLDISAYRGQTLQISFEAQTDFRLDTSFFLDDISIVACAQ
ncbi:MAG: transglycosylase SLT domain-containing protein [Ardenticatenales bacterium]|nr:transglycosylase SLT domain-containing protein [Ardenticatenales bacterium]